MSDTNLKYWQNKFSNKSSVLELTTDKSRSSKINYTLGIESFTFNQRLSTSVKTFSQIKNTNLLSVLITSFSCLLHRYTASEDIVIGSYIQKSDNSGFNTLAFRNYLSGDTLFSQL
ncbi:MAG: condensation domain-containing protein, partial [Cyanobacteria bacterium J06643_5]